MNKKGPTLTKTIHISTGQSSLLSPLRMLLPSLMHTLENIPNLVTTSLTSSVMGMSRDSLTAHTPSQPLVECQMLLEFVAKGKLLQVQAITYIYIYIYICIKLCSLIFYMYIWSAYIMYITVNTVASIV